MNSKLVLRHWATWLAITVVLALQACATQERLVWHSFEFNGRWDDWEETVDLLAYDYGGKYIMVRNSVDNPSHPASKGLKKLSSGIGIDGPMPVGEYLYVKWRVRDTDQVFEERVDLRQRLPADMKDQKITLSIDGSQLYVFIVTNKLKKADQQDLGLKTRFSKPHHNYFVYEIFPNLNRPL